MREFRQVLVPLLLSSLSTRSRSVGQSVSPSLSPLEAFVLFFVLSHRKRMHLFYVPRIYAATGILEDTFHAALGKFFPI